MTSPSLKRPLDDTLPGNTLPGNTLPVLPSTPHPKSRPKECESVKRRRRESLLFRTPCKPTSSSMWWDYTPTTLQFPQDLFSQTELQTPPEESPFLTPRKPTPSKSDTTTVFSQESLFQTPCPPIGGRYTIVCTLSLPETI